MAVLTRSKILKHLKEKSLNFKPALDEFQIQPHSVDLRLGSSFYVPRTWKLTAKGREAINADYMGPSFSKGNFEKVDLKRGQFFEILPGEFVIMTTLELIEIKAENLMAVMYPRSSLNRRGLRVDLSGVIDVWYKGALLIPVANNTQTQMIKMYPGERVCQLVFEELTDGVEKKKASRHGVALAKYSNGSKRDVNHKLDKEIERVFVRGGDIKGLKKEYGVKI